MGVETGFCDGGRTLLYIANSSTSVKRTSILYESANDSLNEK